MIFQPKTQTPKVVLLEVCMCSFLDPRFKTKCIKDEHVLKAIVCDEAVSLYPRNTYI